MTNILTVELGERVEVTTELKQKFQGKLLELDSQNLVIETEPGQERVFRVAKCSYRTVPSRRRVQP